MAITYNAEQHTEGNSDIFTLSYTVSSANEYLLVSVNYFPETSQSVFSVTYGGANLSQLTLGVTETTAATELWYMKNPSVGTADIVVTMDSSAKAVVAAVSLNGVNLDDPVHFMTSVGGKDVDHIPVLMREETGNSILGVGMGYGTVYTYLLPGQESLWNVLYDDTVRMQAVYATSTHTGELAVPNYFSALSTWAIILLNIKAAA